MKKNQKLQTGMIAIAALIVGVLIGSAVQWPNFRTDDLRGSIGRVDRYRNVQITENDISLRNELLDDARLQIQYRDFLNYYYIKAVQTSGNLSRLIDVSSGIEDFQPVYQEYSASFKSFHQFMNSGRVDILNALTAVASLSRDEVMPVVESLNQASNAISRMRHLDSELAAFMMVIYDFLEDSPDKDYPALADVHDLLAMSLFQSAHITQNKPMLKYLDQKPLINDEEGIEELIAGTNLGSSVLEFSAVDAQKLGTGFSDHQMLEQMMRSDILNLYNQVFGNTADFFGSSLDGEQLFCDTEQFRNMSINSDAMQNVMSAVNELSSFDSIMHLIN